ncbi:hypothetical protein JYU34_006673 [Plutella xylostella]|uniref:Uncharacterized protein n=1 Tax=Plutella xylostella TaxID=51655 RepID=A0ABQ7QSK9_PLUXY|nr:hypothetical protein JYU34_006673 [Plutella xylostella]
MNYIALSSPEPTSGATSGDDRRPPATRRAVDVAGTSRVTLYDEKRSFRKLLHEPRLYLINLTSNESVQSAHTQ